MIFAMIAALVAVPLPEPKQYFVQVAVYHGDPLGSKEQGNLDILTRPQLLLTDGQAGFFEVGSQSPVAGHDFKPEQPGIKAQFQITHGKDGKTHCEMGCKYVEPVTVADDSAELRTLIARHVREVRDGGTYNLRLKAVSATEQYWVVYTVRMIPSEAAMRKRILEEQRKK